MSLSATSSLSLNNPKDGDELQKSEYNVYKNFKPWDCK